ncbi:MAG: type II toxin-antitoxin system VapC family toxin [Deltaproteobacteria bacterium]|nr:type II toxin-antitoxin system VapC family toxin [Deltaproteobacteria bacterium]
MRYLLDTHCLLWFLQGARELPAGVARRIEAASAANHVSMASVWEMAIKVGLGKLEVPYSIGRDLPSLLAGNGFVVLPLAFEHLQVVAELPRHHRDPFDRLLVAQARCEALVLLSRDPVFDAYAVRREWA